MSTKDLREALHDEKFKIKELIRQWTRYLEERRHIPADTAKQLRTLLAMSRAMFNNFKQFGAMLVNYDALANPDPMDIDIQGHWDILLMEVEDVYCKFETLCIQEMLAGRHKVFYML